MKTLVRNIGLLAGVGTELRKEGAAMSEVASIKDAWLLIDGESIAAFGPMADGLPAGADETIDAAGRMVIPAFCDSHTHAVWAGSREREFEDKIRGLSYAEIAANGGGILNSADLLHDTSEDELFEQSLARISEMMAAGSGAIEIKSGYGLSTADELKMLRVIRRIKESVPAVVKATFLGGHALARGMSREDYVRLVC
ncbi:MAG: imidazolonepropionase, partial [Bacteroidales bacterium]|nr:imidazolonepropionase [Bacteroidales bacterium]